MSPQINKLFHWFSIVLCIGLGITAVHFALQTRQAKAMTIVPTAAPTSPPGQAAVDLPEINPQADSGVLIRAADLHTYHPEKPRFQVVEYVVQSGDSAFSIARKFGIKPETLLWGNEGMNPDAGMLRVGATLKILPVNGVLHTIKAGDSLEQFQQQYGVPIQDIVNFPGNPFHYEIPDHLTPGEQVIIPNGKSQTAWQEPAGPSVTLVNPGGTTAPGSTGANALAYIYKGFFSWPVFPVLITQPFWSGHGAIDIGLLLHQPVYAAAGGTVVFAAWDTTGFGNLVIIDHGHGILTYYGHNSAFLVKYGQVVYKGQQISEGGSTGNSTGPHVDFRIKVVGIGYVNPSLYLP